MNTGRMLRLIRKRRYSAVVVICVLMALFLALSFVLSSKAIPKACAAHEKRVRAHISKRVYESVRYVTEQMVDEICTRPVTLTNRWLRSVAHPR